MYIVYIACVTIADNMTYVVFGNGAIESLYTSQVARQDRDDSPTVG